MCLFAFVPPKDTESLTYLLFTPTVYDYLTLSCNCIVLRSATDVTHDATTTVISVFDTGWRETVSTMCSFSPFVPFDPSSPLNRVPIRRHRDKEFWEITLYFWCYHFVENYYDAIDGMPVFGAFFFK